MRSTQLVFVLLGLLLGTPSNAQVCSNGIAGVESFDTCCVAECGTCGGAGCGRRGQDAGLTAGDCCIGRIRHAGVFCSDSGAAPCLIDAETCSNGLFGVEASGVCCATGCPQCGGSGCGSQALSVGLTASDCCVGRITSVGVFCGDSGTAPCIIDEPPCGPALTISLEWSESSSDLDLYVTEPDGSIAGFADTMGSAGFLDMDVRSGPGIETYTIYSGLDPDSVDVLGEYQLHARRFSGPTETMWTLKASLIDDEVLFETGDFTESSRTETFSVSVTEYDPNCEGTEVFSPVYGVSTSSPEDKLP